MSENRPTKRILVQSAPKSQPTLAVKADAERIMDDLLSIIETEVIKYKHITSTGKSLDLKEARVLQGYAKCLSELLKEQRERQDDQKWGDMTTEEIVALVGKVQSNMLPEGDQNDE
jgi:hypothetical protein